MSQITKEELEKWQNINKKYSAIRNDLGSLKMQEQKLLSFIPQVEEEDQALRKELYEKYGEIKINPDGTFEKENKDGESK